MKDEIGELVRFYFMRGIRYETMLGKGVYGKRLQQLLKEEHDISTTQSTQNRQSTPQIQPPKSLLQNQTC